MTIRSSALNSRIQSTAEGIITRSCQEQIYSPAGGFRLMTPSRSRNTQARATNDLLLCGRSSCLGGRAKKGLPTVRIVPHEVFVGGAARNKRAESRRPQPLATFHPGPPRFGHAHKWRQSADC